MIKIGVLGASKIAPAAIISPVARRSDCEIVAVACRNADRGKRFAQEHSIPNIETDYEKLVQRPDVDLVYNGLMQNRHADLSITALEAGKVVLCEKPFAMNAKEALAMLKVAEENKLILIEAFHYRYHPAFQRAYDIVRSGLIGKIKQFSASFDVPIPAEDNNTRHELSLGGGALMDLGCYPLHWARTITGFEPKILDAEAITGAPGIDLSIKATLSFPQGIMANIQCSMAKDVTMNAEMTITGENGILHMQNPVHPYLGHLITTTVSGKIETETVDGNTTFDHQLDHVIQVMHGKAKPLTGGKDALANMLAIDDIYKKAGMKPRGI